MAAVYRATDLYLGRTVAVKLFRMDTADDAGPERQSGEVTVLASLNHFALVTLFDAGTAVIDGISRTFIVMEFVDGTDLRSRIAAGALHPVEVATMGADLAEALHHVHKQGIIHRDIKPANVLLAPSGFPGRGMHAKLADFGIARLFDATHLTATGALLGTAGYLSPEQALGTTIGPPTDVYSLGLVLLECLTGERAFTGTAIESAMARLQRQPRIPTELGQAWHEVLSGMTTRDPAERLTAGDAAVLLRRLVTADVTGAAGILDATAVMGADATAATELLGVREVLDPTAPLGAPEILAATAVLGTPETLDPTAILAAPEALDPTAILAAPGSPEPVEVLDATKLMASPAPGADEPTEVFARTNAPTAGAPRATAPSRWRNRRLLVPLVVAAALVVLAAIAFAPRAAAPAAPPAGYPAVDGPLGTHLQQLQESLTP
jgi:tRNA A-37 threonylcarbamoyl transferase component Bud32